MNAGHWVEVAGPYLLVALLSAAWAVVEVAQTFPDDTRRALRTGGARLLVGANVGFACLAYTVVLSLVSSTANRWLVALAAGAGWQALLRSRINLFQSMAAPQHSISLISLADLYASLQQFCLRHIDQALIAAREDLLEEALALDVEDLKRRVRLQGHASALTSEENVTRFLERVHQETDPEAQKLLLASFLLQEKGYEGFERWMKAVVRRQQATSNPAEQE